MKEKIINNKRKIVLGLILAMILVLSGVSYAYFSARVTENNKTETIIKTNTLGLTYTGEVEINCSNIIPGDSCTKTFKVENTSNVAVTYNIYMESITNEFNEDLVYTLTDDNGEVIEETALPETNEGKKYLKTNISIDSEQIKNYTLKIEYKYDETKNQNAYQGKTFKATVGIDTEQIKVETNENGVAYCDSLVRADYGNYTLGKEYVCDPGDGIERTFYLLENGEDLNTTVSTAPGYVSLIMNENIDNNPVAYSDSGYTYMGVFTARDVLAEKTSTWNHTDEVVMPSAQQVANAAGDKNWMNDYKSNLYNLPEYLQTNLEYTSDTGSSVYGYYTQTVVSVNNFDAFAVRSSGLSRESVSKGYFGIRPVIKIKVKDTKKVVSKGNIETVGTQVFVNGTMWYVMSTTEDKVNLISAYNLNKWDGYMTQDISEATNEVAFDIPGERADAQNSYCTQSELYGCNAYAAVEGTYTNGEYSGLVTKDSTIKKYVDKYVNSIGVPAEGRLMSLEEILSLMSCDASPGLTNYDCMNSRTQNQFISQYSPRYWIDTKPTFSTSFAYVVSTANNTENETYIQIYLTTQGNTGTWNTLGWGIRPVITIDKSLLK